MIETLNRYDTWLFYQVNHHHCTATDWVMWVLSQHWSWAVVLAAAFAFITLRREPKRWWVAVAGVVLCFLLADQGSVHLFKETVCRLRPCHVLEDVRMFRTHCGGRYGFVSSHAANSFAIAVFMLLRYGRRDGKATGPRDRWRSLVGPMLLLLWAAGTSYSRAYLGKHYPGDLLCGALFGVLVGGLVWWLTHFFEKKIYARETK